MPTKNVSEHHGLTSKLPENPRVQCRDNPCSSHCHSGVTLLFLCLAPHRLKPVQKFWGPSVERKPQNPSIPRATVSRSCSAVTTQARTGAGGCCTGQQVTWPLLSWVTLGSHAQTSWGNGQVVRGSRPGAPPGMWQNSHL